MLLWMSERAGGLSANVVTHSKDDDDDEGRGEITVFARSGVPH